MVANRLDLLVADYLAHCRAKGLAPNTVSGAYAFPLNQVFLPWCVKQGITEPEQLTSRAGLSRQPSGPTPQERPGLAIAAPVGPNRKRPGPRHKPRRRIPTVHDDLDRARAESAALLGYNP